MRKVLLVLSILTLSGCAQWNQLSDQEKAAVIVGGAVLVGANLISNTQSTHVHNCISTRSLETGCPRR